LARNAHLLQVVKLETDVHEIQKQVSALGSLESQVLAAQTEARSSDQSKSVADLQRRLDELDKEIAGMQAMARGIVPSIVIHGF
jgi:uncharacterized protein HemX